MEKVIIQPKWSGDTGVTMIPMEDHTVEERTMTGGNRKNKKYIGRWSKRARLLDDWGKKVQTKVKKAAFLDTYKDHSAGTLPREAKEKYVLQKRRNIWEFNIAKRQRSRRIPHRNKRRSGLSDRLPHWWTNF